MQAAINLTAVSFRYKTGTELVLKQVDLSVQEGECIALQGASGSGKSSVCRLIVGLIPHSYEGELSGEIRVFGKDTTQYRVQSMARYIGMVMQEPEMQIIGRTVFEDVAFGLRNYLVPKSEIEDRVTEALDLVGLAGFEHRKSDELSGGEKQRLAISGILAVKPKILVLDDPTSELDPIGRKRIYHLLNELRRNNRLTIVLVDRHSTDLSIRVDRIAVLEKGRIVWTGAFHEQSGRKPVQKQHGRFSARKPQAAGRFSEGIPLKKSMPIQPLLEVKDLNFGYHTDTSILEHIDLSIGSGDYLALIGNNGAGKTTLVKHFNGLIKPHRNCIFFEGQDITTIDPKKRIRSVGLVFQNPDHQLFESSVEKEIGFGLRNLGYKKKEACERVQKTLHDTGLTAFKEMHPYALPKGRRQIVAIASIIVLCPKLLVIDEPTTGLDEQGVERVMHLCDNLHAAGTAIVLISHDPSLIGRKVGRTVILKRGRIVSDTKTDGNGIRRDTLNFHTSKPATRFQRI